MAVTVGRSASHLMGPDLSWAFAAAAPSALAAFAVAFFALKSRPRAASIAGAVLALPCALGGAWGMLMCTDNDAKWICVWAGAVSALAAIVAAIAGRLAAHTRA
jgi:hypothetical protein